jgi:hypothetical protein
MCKVAVCDRDEASLGLCGSHYARQVRTGSPGTTAIGPALPQGFKPGHPPMGAFVTGHIGNTNNRGKHNGLPRREAWIGYGAAHDRLRRDRGPASGYTCVDCGNSAQDWSYNHRDPNEYADSRLNGHGTLTQVTYSGDGAYYDPRCKPCHTIFDGAMI